MQLPLSQGEIGIIIGDIAEGRTVSGRTPLQILLNE